MKVSALLPQTSRRKTRSAYLLSCIPKPIAPHMVHARSPMCHMKQRVQNGSAAAGPAGQLARFDEMLAKKACDSPAPPVSGMPAGMDDGMIQPAALSATIAGFSLYVTPSLISNIVGCCTRAARAGTAATRAARGAKEVAESVAGERRAGAKALTKAMVVVVGKVAGRREEVRRRGWSGARLFGRLVQLTKGIVRQI